MDLGGNDRNDGRRDIERAIAALVERLPQPLWPLASLAFNYRWTWMPDAAALFREIDPAAWRHGEGNPVSVIETVLPRRLNELAGTASFVARVEALAAA